MDENFLKEMVSAFGIRNYCSLSSILFKFLKDEPCVNVLNVLYKIPASAFKTRTVVMLVLASKFYYNAEIADYEDAKKFIAELTKQVADGRIPYNQALALIFSIPLDTSSNRSSYTKFQNEITELLSNSQGIFSCKDDLWRWKCIDSEIMDILNYSSYSCLPKSVSNGLFSLSWDSILRDFDPSNIIKINFVTKYAYSYIGCDTTLIETINSRYMYAACRGIEELFKGYLYPLKTIATYNITKEKLLLLKERYVDPVLNENESTILTAITEFSSNEEKFASRIEDNICNVKNLIGKLYELIKNYVDCQVDWYDDFSEKVDNIVNSLKLLGTI